MIGDSKTPTVNIVGDKLQDRKKVEETLDKFKLECPLGECYESLIGNLNKT